MAQTAIAVEDLELRTHKTVRLFADGAFAPSAGQACERIVCSSKFGLALAVLPSARLLCYKTAELHALLKSSETEPDVENFPSRVIDYYQENVDLSFLSLSCNGRVLAVAVNTAQGPFVHLYDILAFAPGGTAQPFPLSIVRITTDNNHIMCIEWNPELEEIFTVASSDGQVSTFSYSLATRNTFAIVGTARLPAAPTCLSWSRKGKQLVIGDAAGRLHQLKPELAVVRVVDAPAQLPNMGQPIMCAGVFWVATTDWLIAYREHANPLKVTLAFLTVKKNQPPAWQCLGDVTYQRPNAPPLDTALHFVSLMDWNMVLVYAHRSPDVVVVGQRNGAWVAFVMERFAVTMPLDARKADSYPLGVTLDMTNAHNVTLERPGADAALIPPQPMLYALSSAGALRSWHVCSLDQTRPSLVKPAENFGAANALSGDAPLGYQPRAALVQQQPAPTQLPFGTTAAHTTSTPAQAAPAFAPTQAAPAFALPQASTPTQAAPAAQDANLSAATSVTIVPPPKATSTPQQTEAQARAEKAARLKQLQVSAD